MTFAIPKAPVKSTKPEHGGAQIPPAGYLGTLQQPKLAANFVGNAGSERMAYEKGFGLRYDPPYAFTQGSVMSNLQDGPGADLYIATRRRTSGKTAPSARCTR